MSRHAPLTAPPHIMARIRKDALRRAARAKAEREREQAEREAHARAASGIRMSFFGTLRDAVEPAPPAVAAPVVAPTQEAIGFLAAQLKPDDSVKREAHRAACMKQFKISGRVFDTIVWPTARERAGLPRQGKPGRKRAGNR